MSSEISCSIGWVENYRSIKNEKNTIPAAKNIMYRGFPCPNIEVIETKIEFSAEDEKLESVIGSNNNAEAKIAGITPAVLTFRGK